MAALCSEHPGCPGIGRSIKGLLARRALRMNHSTFQKIFWHQIPPTRVGVFSGRIHCPCEVQFWDMMDRFFPDVVGKTLLDVGCGPGVKALTFALAGAHVTGFDVRESAIHHALENTRQIRQQQAHKFIEAQFFHHNIERGFSQIETASVDIVLFVEVIEHLRQYELVLAEIRRILKPDGSVVITTPNKDFQGNRAEHDEAVYGEKAFGHVREFDPDGLAEAMRNAGLQITWQGFMNPPTSTDFCRWIHPWMIRDHGFLQQKEGIEDVIGIRTLGFLQPLYNLFFPMISWCIKGYNSFFFPMLYRLASQKNLAQKSGKTLLAIGTPS